MAIETRARAIDGKQYKVTQLGAVQGRKVFTRLLRIIAPLLAAKDPSLGLADVAAHITEADLDALCEVFAAKTMIPTTMSNGAEVPLAGVFDDHFAANYGGMMRWLMFCLEVNFASFFAETGLSAAPPATA